MGFLGKIWACPIFENYVKITLSKYGPVRTMMNSKGMFFLKFNSQNGVNAMLENGHWFIHNVPLILKNRSQDANLLKEDVCHIPV